MTEILVGPDVDHVPDCWSKFCMHCASKMWDSNLSIDQVIREELIPYLAILHLEHFEVTVHLLTN